MRGQFNKNIANIAGPRRGGAFERFSQSVSFLFFFLFSAPPEIVPNIVTPSDFKSKHIIDHRVIHTRCTHSVAVNLFGSFENRYIRVMYTRVCVCVYLRPKVLIAKN